tara:strand:+ start:2845 stop:3525 length:681 start_codon:yes stop_codon:yes gene_type:complete
VLSRFFASRNLEQDDGAVYLSNFLDNPTDYLAWKDVETCLNRDDVYWELIKEDGRKKDVQMYKPYWSPVPCQEKKTIHEHIRQGLSFVITGYSKVNRKVSNLCIEVERSCDVNTGVHVYGSRGRSPSFPIHCDNFSNFIIQTVGSTYWQVYKNRHTSLLRPSNDKPLNHDILEIDWEGILSPGDLLYIPNRAYHQARPDEPRLSMSIPCAPDVINSNFYDRRYYQV